MVPLALAALFCSAATPSGAADPGRGRYLAEAAGCGRCHTASDAGAPSYAGGRVLDTDSAGSPAPNITPDRQTGIGGWSEADFVRAMRWGIAPDNSHYLPVFPFPYYNRLTDSRPRRHQGVSRHAAAGVAPRAAAQLDGAMGARPRRGGDRGNPDARPLARRSGQGCRYGIVVPTSSPRSAAAASAIRRARWLGTPDPDRLLAGGLDRNGRRAPNITSDPKAGIGNWSTDDIVTMLTDGTTPNFDEVGHSMAEIVKNTAKLNEEDRRAIAAYLQSVPPISGPERK